MNEGQTTGMRISKSQANIYLFLYKLKKINRDTRIGYFRINVNPSLKRKNKLILRIDFY